MKKNCVICDAEFEGYNTSKYCGNEPCIAIRRERKRKQGREYAMRPEVKTLRKEYQRTPFFKRYQKLYYNKRTPTKGLITILRSNYIPLYDAEGKIVCAIKDADEAESMVIKDRTATLCETCNNIFQYEPRVNRCWECRKSVNSI